MTAVGDLVESMEQQGDQRRRLIFLGPPRFVRRPQVDEIILLGIRPDNAQLVGDEQLIRLEQRGVVRRLPRATDADIQALVDFGLHEISDARWMGHEDPCDPSSLVERYSEILKRQPRSGEIEGLTVLDSARPNRYYRGRWGEPTADHHGQFVARRRQAFGSHLWCLVELDQGLPTKLLDLPLDPNARGSDEAWRLQAAIDATRSNPQPLAVARTGSGLVNVGLPAPPPRWVQRRWDLLGEPSQMRGMLLAYQFTPATAREEIQFLREQMWMKIEVEQGDNSV